MWNPFKKKEEPKKTRSKEFLDKKLSDANEEIYKKTATTPIKTASVAIPKPATRPVMPPTFSQPQPNAASTAASAASRAAEKNNQKTRKEQESIEPRPSVVQPEAPKREMRKRPGFVNIHGIELPEGKDKSGAPHKEGFSDYIEDSFAIELQRRIATGWLLDEPVLCEGGTSLGKTRTVMKMSADLGYQVHKLVLSRETDKMELVGSPTVNPNQGEADANGKVDERKFIMVLSELVKAITPEEGKVKVCLIDEINAAMPGVLIKLHQILDAYKFNGSDIVFPELGGLRVKVDKDKVKFVGLMNPPGGGYSDRNQMDPANLRRWVYHKLPDSLPKENLRSSIGAVFGLNSKGNVSSRPPENRETMMQNAELAAIPGMDEILVHYLTFHEAMKDFVSPEKRQLGKNQPQRFTFDDREEPRRVREYILRFYDGNITKTMQEALRYIYGGKILDEIDKKKVEELIRKVSYTPPVSKSRIGLGAVDPNAPKNSKFEAAKVFGKELLVKPIKPTPDNIRKIVKVLGSDRFVGAKDKAKDWGISASSFKSPDIPFSLEEIINFNEDEILTLKLKDTSKNVTDANLEWVKQKI